jgi:hypothetical protein
MLDKKSYDSFLEKGNKAQELFIQFMEGLGHEFLAGDRNGSVLNIDLIEEICSCKYIYPNSIVSRGKHGPRLLFSSGNKNGYTMPDELFVLSNKSKIQFYDVKNRRQETLYEKMEKIVDYSEIDSKTGINTFVVILIWNSFEKGYDIYARRAFNIWKENKHLEMNDKCPLDLSKFKKLNNYSIKP